MVTPRSSFTRSEFHPEAGGLAEDMNIRFRSFVFLAKDPADETKMDLEFGTLPKSSGMDQGDPSKPQLPNSTPRSKQPEHELGKRETSEPQKRPNNLVKQLLCLYQSNSRSCKFLFAAGGICVSYLLHGYFTEDLYLYSSPADGGKFRYAWLMQLLESCMNVLVAFVYRVSFGGECDLPLSSLFVVGASQLFAKTFTGLALAAGLSYPVCTLSKSAKMVPVMIGQLAVGGSSFSLMDYIVAGSIVGGAAILSLGDRKASEGDHIQSDTTLMGLAFILTALLMDGVTAGLQVGLKANMLRAGKVIRTNDFMLWANVAMSMTASVICGATGDWTDGWTFLGKNPAVLRMVLITCVCSAAGQSFVFFMITHFDPLACSTVTTSRKIMSVIWSISSKGHHFSLPSAFGVGLAIFGLVLETRNNFTPSKRASHK